MSTKQETKMLETWGSLTREFKKWVDLAESKDKRIRDLEDQVSQLTQKVTTLSYLVSSGKTTPCITNGMEAGTKHTTTQKRPYSPF